MEEAPKIQVRFFLRCQENDELPKRILISGTSIAKEYWNRYYPIVPVVPTLPFLVLRSGHFNFLYQSPFSFLLPNPTNNVERVWGDLDLVLAPD